MIDNWSLANYVDEHCDGIGLSSNNIWVSIGIIVYNEKLQKYGNIVRYGSEIANQVWLCPSWSTVFF